MQNCKKFKTHDEAINAWTERRKIFFNPLQTIDDAMDFIRWLYEDDGCDYVNSPKQYKLADGRDLQDIFWEVSQYGAMYFSVFNSCKYEFRRGKKEIAPPEEDMKKSNWYINDIVKRTKHPYDEIRAKVDDILNKAYSVRG